MGSLLKPLLEGHDRAEIQIVSWEGVTGDVADIVQRVVGSPLRPLGFTAADLAHRHGAFSPIEPNRRVVVLTDVVVTARTISRILRTLRRMEAVPIAVVAIIDGRIDHGSPIRSFAGLVPVLACAGADVLAPLPVPANVRVVDVTTRGLPVPPAPSVDYPIGADRFVGWLRSQARAGIYVGHIDRGPTRHFSTYLDIAGLVETNPAVAAAVAESVATSLGDCPSDEAVCVVFPGPGETAAPALGAQVAGLLESLLNKPVTTVQALRDREIGWRTHPGQEWPFAFRAVVIDWGAVTASTVRDLVDLAARNGAGSVHVVVLTSQLERDAERRMRAIAAVRVSVPPRTAPGVQAELELDILNGEPRDVPVSTEFLAGVPMGMAARSDCHLCALAQLMRDIGRRSPTRLMRQHAQAKYDLYKPRAPQDILNGHATDLVGTELGPEAAAEVWSWHLRLVEAQTSRVAQASLRSAVLRWRADAATQDPLSWLRLLTVEPYWLDRAPLDASDVRAHIGRTCVAVLITSPTNRFSVGARWQAAIVLRSASKRIFLERFGEVLDAVADQELIATELCQGMLTILERPYNLQVDVLNGVLTALLDARDRLREKGRRDKFTADLLFTVNALYRDAVAKRTSLDARGDAVAAWHGLQSTYALGMHTHAGALTAMLVVLNALSGPAAQRAASRPESLRDPAYWERVCEAWDVCWDFMAHAVFPYLPGLTDLFEGHVPSFVSGTSASLLSFDARRAAVFGERLAEIRHAPNTFQEPLRSDLETEALAWFEGFLRAPERQSDASQLQVRPGSELIRVLDENPCDLGAAWAEARTRVTDSGGEFKLVADETLNGTWVFCRRRLLVDTLVHVLENATSTDRRDLARAGQVEIAGYVQSAGPTIRLLIRNSSTVISSPREGGLTKLADQLAPFGGSLVSAPADTRRKDYDFGSPRPSTPWTYEVELTLRSWNS